MNRRATTIDRPIPGKVRGLTALLLTGLFLVPTRSDGQTGKATFERPAGRRVAGRIEGDAASGFRFVPSGEGAADGQTVALEPGSILHFEGSVADPLASPPPFHVFVGMAARLSGSLRDLTRDSVRLSVGRPPYDVTLPRGCVQAIVQQPGEARVLAESFQSLDPTRWAITGKPELAAQRGPGERRSLRLPVRGASLTHNLEEPLAAGRLELAFEDDGAVAAGRECVIEATFRGPAGRSVMRIILGWSEESLAVESTSGPGLPVQRLARTPGWHRLTLRFGPERTEISVDGKELAHGKGPGGLLTSIRLATQGSGPAPRRPLEARFEDLQLFRFAEPPASVEIDVTQDEARLVDGDQLYGEVREADSRQVVLTVDGNPVSLRWGDVSGLYFRRRPIQSPPIEGLLVRVEWRPSLGDRPDDLDFAEGALLAISPESLRLATPYSGVLAIARRDLRRIVVLGRGRRIIIDPSTHHLGDEISVTPPLFDPPQPEGLVLDRTIELTQPADRPVVLSLDVLQVIPEVGEAEYSRQVRNGELRTYVAINDHRFDGCDLRLISLVKQTSGLPTAGKNLIVVAAVDHVLHFRIFDGEGKVVVDTDEKRLMQLAPQIEGFRKQLEGLWPPHELTKSEKGRAIEAATSIVGYTRFDYLNRYIKTGNEAPERIRIPIPRDLLRTGKNELRIEVTGTSGMRSLYDDLGILQIALEFP